MARLLAALLLIAAALLMVVGQIDAGAPSEAEEFWRSVLSDSPLPDAIQTLLHPEINNINKAEDTHVDKHSSRMLSNHDSPQDIFIKYGPPQRQSSPRPFSDDGTQELSQDVFVKYGPPQRQPSPKSSVDNIVVDTLSKDIFVKYSPPQRQSSPSASGDDEGTQGFSKDIFVKYGPPQRQSTPRASGDHGAEQLPQDIFVKYGPPQRQSSPSASGDDEGTQGFSKDIFVKYVPPQRQSTPRASGDDGAEQLPQDIFVKYGPPQRQSSPSASGDDEGTQGFSKDIFVKYGPPQRQSTPRTSGDDSVGQLSQDIFVKYGPPQRQSSPRPFVVDTYVKHGPHRHSPPSDDNTGGSASLKAMFFHEEAIQVGKNATFYFPPAIRASLRMLPRHVADSIPFSTSSLPSALARLNIAADSVQAGRMLNTLRMCELPPVAEEARFCATSLESLVEGAMAALGTHDIRPVTSNLHRSGLPIQTYTIRDVRPVDGSSFVSCHDMEYPYAVYLCHGTGSARAYMVDMEGGGRGDMVTTVATVCHTDTALWDPEHISFKILGTKPGGKPVCHVLPYGNVMWAKNAILASA